MKTCRVPNVCKPVLTFCILCDCTDGRVVTWPSHIHTVSLLALCSIRPQQHSNIAASTNTCHTTDKAYRVYGWHEGSGFDGWSLFCRLHEALAEVYSQLTTPPVPVNPHPALTQIMLKYGRLLDTSYSNVVCTAAFSVFCCATCSVLCCAMSCCAVPCNALLCCSYLI